MHTQRTEWYTGIYPSHSNMKTMIICRLWSNCLHDQLSLPNQRAFSNLLCSIHFLGEIATLRENIPQLSCLLRQLCQVWCGWGQSQTGRSMVNSPAVQKLSTLPGQIPLCGSSFSTISYSCKFLFIYLLIPWTEVKLVLFGHSKPKVCSKMENGTCLVVECMRSCLPVQGQGSDPGSGKSPHESG